MCHCEQTFSEINTRLAHVELLLEQLVQARSFPQPPLNDTETKIVALLGAKSLKGAAIARRLECPYNSNFKNTLSFLVRTGALRKTRKGYVVASPVGEGHSTTLMLPIPRTR